MHGGNSPGAPRGEQHPNFRHGKYTKQTKQLSALMRELARAGETLLVKTLDAHGLGRKLPAALRRRTHIKKARAARKAQAKAAEETK